MGNLHSRTRKLLGPLAIPTLVLISVGNSGCRDAPARGGFSIDTLPSGVVEIQNPAEGVWAPGGAWVVEELFRLGSEAHNSPELFSSIPDIKLGPLGRIWLIEGQDQEIRVFDGDGSHVRTFGRRGQGPGEFSNVAALLWSPGGELWAVDQRGGRVSVFDTTGTFQESKRLESFFQMMPWPGGLDDLGYFYDVRQNPDLEAPDFLVRLDSVLQVVDTIQLLEHPDGPQQFVDQSDHSFTTVAIPFSGDADWVLAPGGGMWVTITDRYEILRIGWSGDTLRVVRKEFNPIPVTSGEIDEALKNYDWFEGEIERSRIPGFKPAVIRTVLDDLGNLWVFPWKDENERGYVAEVFDSMGVYLGDVHFPVPLNTGEIDIRGNTLVAVTRDSLYVPSVYVLSIRKPGEDRR
jgi:hypothetical protein